MPWRPRLLAAGTIALAVWALRVALIGDLGMGIPLLDQWDSEGLFVYEPWVQGQFSWRAIFEPYLEHRIAWTHLWNIGLFEIGGQWDPMVQMVAQAVIPALTAGFCVWGLVAAYAGWPWRSAVLLGALIAFGAPFSYQNILWGFQSCFAFWVVLSLCGCAATALAWRNPRYGWLALFAGLAAPFALGAGILVGPIIFALAVLVMLIEKKITRRSKGIMAVGLICFLWGLLVRSQGTGATHAHAKSVAQTVQAWLAACAWPNSAVPWLAGWACWPAVILLIQLVRKGLLPRPHELFIIGIFIWALLSAVGGAWARGALGSMPPSRYCDFLTLLCWANLLALITVMGAWWKTGVTLLRLFGAVIALAWVGSVVYGGVGLLERFFKTERPALQKIVVNQFAVMHTILEGGVTATGIVERNGKRALPYQEIMESRVLAPFLPPEIQRPFRGMTPEGILMMRFADSTSAWQWQSEPFETQSSAMLVFINSDWRKLNLELLRQGVESKTYFQPSGRQVAGWSEWLVRTMPGRYRLNIESASGSGDLSIILPRPLSAPGYWVRWVGAESTFLIELAGVCFAVALLVCRDKASADENNVPTD